MKVGEEGEVSKSNYEMSVLNILMHMYMCKGNLSQHCQIPAHFAQMIEIIVDLSQTIHSFITWQFHITYMFMVMADLASFPPRFPW